MRMPRTLTCPRPGPEAGDDQLLTLSLETRLCSRLTAVLQVAAPLSVSAALGALRDEGCQPLHLPVPHWPVSIPTRAPIGLPVSAGCSNPDDWRSLQSLGRGHCRVCRAAICSHLVRLETELCTPQRLMFVLTVTMCLMTSSGHEYLSLYSLLSLSPCLLLSLITALI